MCQENHLGILTVKTLTNTVSTLTCRVDAAEHCTVVVVESQLSRGHV